VQPRPESSTKALPLLFTWAVSMEVKTMLGDSLDNEV